MLRKLNKKQKIICLIRIKKLGCSYTLDIPYSQIGRFRINSVEQLAHLVEISVHRVHSLYDGCRRIHYNFVPERRYAGAIGVRQKSQEPCNAFCRSSVHSRGQPLALAVTLSVTSARIDAGVAQTIQHTFQLSSVLQQPDFHLPAITENWIFMPEKTRDLPKKALTRMTNK